MRGGRARDETHELDVVSAHSTACGKGLLPALVKVSGALPIDNEDENGPSPRLA